MQPVGRYVIQVCDGLSCYLVGGAGAVAEYISTKLNVAPGETTLTVSRSKVQCLASCGTAPPWSMIAQSLTGDH
jgi:NADH:ubiquinone oxidoreductase subunit E